MISRFVPGAYTVLILPVKSGVISFEVVTIIFHFVGIRLFGENFRWISDWVSG